MMWGQKLVAADKMKMANWQEQVGRKTSPFRLRMTPELNLGKRSSWKRYIMTILYKAPALNREPLIIPPLFSSRSFPA